MFCNGRFESVVHHCLESGGGVCHSEEHYQWFEEASSGFERSFVFVSGFDAYVCVSPSDVEFGEDPGSAEVRDQFGYEREWVLVAYGPFVEVSVVLYRP